MADIREFLTDIEYDMRASKDEKDRNELYNQALGAIYFYKGQFNLNNRLDDVDRTYISEKRAMLKSLL